MTPGSLTRGKRVQADTSSRLPSCAVLLRGGGEVSGIEAQPNTSQSTSSPGRIDIEVEEQITVRLVGHQGRTLKPKATASIVRSEWRCEVKETALSDGLLRVGGHTLSCELRHETQEYRNKRGNHINGKGWIFYSTTKPPLQSQRAAGSPSSPPVPRHEERRPRHTLQGAQKVSVRLRERQKLCV